MCICGDDNDVRGAFCYILFSFNAGLYFSNNGDGNDVRGALCCILFSSNIGLYFSNNLSMESGLGVRGIFFSDSLFFFTTRFGKIFLMRFYTILDGYNMIML